LAPLAWVVRVPQTGFFLGAGLAVDLVLAREVADLALLRVPMMAEVMQRQKKKKEGGNRRDETTLTDDS
jgi:hypothetical protein